MHVRIIRSFSSDLLCVLYSRGDRQSHVVPTTCFAWEDYEGKGQPLGPTYLGYNLLKCQSILAKINRNEASVGAFLPVIVHGIAYHFSFYICILLYLFSLLLWLACWAENVESDCSSSNGSLHCLCLALQVAWSHQHPSSFKIKLVRDVSYSGTHRWVFTFRECRSRVRTTEAAFDSCMWRPWVELNKCAVYCFGRSWAHPVKEMTTLQ